MKISKLWLCLPLFLFLSCTASQKTSSSVTAQSYRSDPPSNNPPVDPAIARFIVPPELGVIEGKIHSSATSFTKVAELLATNSDKLEKGIAQTKGCSYRMLDYQHLNPMAWGSQKSLSSKNKQHSGSLKFEILIPLSQAKDIQARIGQIDSCLTAISKLELSNPEDKDTSINLSLSQVLLTVEDAGKHRQKLLEFKSQPLKEVASLSQPPIQFDAKDYKCASKGNVTVMDRKLSGIELDIDYDCRRLTKE